MIFKSKDDFGESPLQHHQKILKKQEKRAKEKTVGRKEFVESIKRLRLKKEAEGKWSKGKKNLKGMGK